MKSAKDHHLPTEILTSWFAIQTSCSVVTLERGPAVGWRSSPCCKESLQQRLCQTIIQGQLGAGGGSVPQLSTNVSILCRPQVVNRSQAVLPSYSTWQFISFKTSRLGSPLALSRVPRMKPGQLYLLHFISRPVVLNPCSANQLRVPPKLLRNLGKIVIS